MSHEQRYRQAFDKMRNEPFGAEKLAMAREMVHVADLSGNPDLKFHGRLALVSSLVFLGESQEALVVFAWLLGQYDQDPEKYEFYNRSLLWRYKWMVGKLADYPTFSLSDVLGRFDDIESRFKRAGFNLRAYWQQRGWLALGIHDDDGLRTALEQWRSLETDDVSDCDACEANFEVKARLALGEVGRALEVARPLVNESMSCENIPHATYGELLRYVEPEQALAYHRRGWEMISDRVSNFDDTFAHHVRYALTLDVEDARSMISEHFASFQKVTPLATCNVLDAALLTMRASPEPLNILGGRDIAILSNGVMDDAAVGRIRTELAELVRAFDARNGNDGFAKEFRESLNA